VCVKENMAMEEIHSLSNWLVSEETGREINEYLSVGCSCCVDGNSSPLGNSSEGSVLTL